MSQTFNQSPIWSESVISGQLPVKLPIKILFPEFFIAPKLASWRDRTELVCLKFLILFEVKEMVFNYLTSFHPIWAHLTIIYHYLTSFDPIWPPYLPLFNLIIPHKTSFDPIRPHLTPWKPWKGHETSEFSIYESRLWKNSTSFDGICNQKLSWPWGTLPTAYHEITRTQSS